MAVFDHPGEDSINPITCSHLNIQDIWVVTVHTLTMACTLGSLDYGI